MTIKKSKVKVNNRGAPMKDEDKKVNDYHVYVWQWKRIVDEAEMRGISPFNFLRQIIDWFFTALDTGRADVTASKLFDENFDKPFDEKAFQETVEIAKRMGITVKRDTEKS